MLARGTWDSFSKSKHPLRLSASAGKDIPSCIPGQPSGGLMSKNTLPHLCLLLVTTQPNNANGSTPQAAIPVEHAIAATSSILPTTLQDTIRSPGIFSPFIN